MLLFNENGGGKIKFNEYVLLIPSVSVGNVGQLTVDLLITTLSLNKIGYIRHKNILPVAGHASGSLGIATECEVYGSAELKIAVIQIRSTFGKFSTISNFFTDLCKSVKATVIITGGFAYERKNIHLIEDTLRFITSDAFHKCSLPLISQHWRKLEVPQNESSSSRIRVPGSGIADHLFNRCVEEGIPAALIVNFLSEGDNKGDAVNLANYLDSWLKLRNRAGSPEDLWRFPSVWDSLFGNTYPQELFF